ncbi:MAG: zinc ribbon domain-containing protein [Firmicutes bacterium]|nr:zinc ribbon domain-containing protein [Bacillota bacterium]
MKIHCWECGEQISDAAPMCPKCGATQTRTVGGVRRQPVAIPVATPVVAESEQTCKKPRQKFFTFIFVSLLVMLCVAGMQLANAIALIPILIEEAEFLSNYAGDIPSEVSVDLALNFVSVIFVFVLAIICLLNFIFLLISKKAGFILTRRVLAMTSAVLTIVSAVVTAILLTLAMSIYFNLFSFEDISGYAHYFIGDFVSSMIIYGAMTGVLIATFIKSLFYFFSIKSNNVELQ